jgi:phage terminase small subunit
MSLGTGVGLSVNKNPFMKISGARTVGRNGQPIDILIAKGKKHLTKGEIETRKKSELKLGINKLRCPSFMKNDVAAYAKWKEINKVYKDVDFVSSGDTGLLARYCMTFSEYQRMLIQRSRIDNFEVNYKQLEQHFDAELLEGLDTFFKFEPVMQLENAINKKMDMLIKMEDRLFLNPLAKVKNIPKTEPEKKDPLTEKGFGNV